MGRLAWQHMPVIAALQEIEKGESQVQGRLGNLKKHLITKQKINKDQGYSLAQRASVQSPVPKQTHTKRSLHMSIMCILTSLPGSQTGTVHRIHWVLIQNTLVRSLPGEAFLDLRQDLQTRCLPGRGQRITATCPGQTCPPVPLGLSLGMIKPHSTENYAGFWEPGHVRAMTAEWIKTKPSNQLEDIFLQMIQIRCPSPSSGVSFQ